jgi:hypothetical protein
MEMKTMKLLTIFSLSLVLIFTSNLFAQSASDINPINFLKSKFPTDVKIGSGVTASGEQCSVTVKHDNKSDDNSEPLFSVSIHTDDYQIQTTYIAYNWLVAGRGDCPVLTKKSEDIFVVKNLGTLPPCFSNPKRINQGGFAYYADDNSRTFSILNKEWKILKSCRIINL